MASSKALERYRGRRDFARTAEPRGGPARRGWSFVVQKHAARQLHYDFRLELDGVLLSWAVPRGPSLNPSEKRLATQTEDHPVEYREFEGTIPAGHYGAGTVMVWDCGTWSPEGDARAAYRSGRLNFVLFGQKLRGRWHLVRTRGNGKQPSWLLIKGRDVEARGDGDGLLEREPNSALTGRTLEQIAKPRRSPATRHDPGPALALEGAPEKPLSSRYEVELTTLVRQVPEGSDWLYERSEGAHV